MLGWGCQTAVPKRWKLLEPGLGWAIETLEQTDGAASDVWQVWRDKQANWERFGDDFETASNTRDTGDAPQETGGYPELVQGVWDLHGALSA